MNDLPVVLVHLFWVIPLTLLIIYIGSPGFRGTSGQTRARRMLSAMLQKNLYTVFTDLTIPAGGGNLHINNLVVSQFGIFVIGNVNRAGKISGTEFQDLWKQYRFGRFTRFDNPLHQNYLVINALQRLLNLPETVFHSIVVVSSTGSIADKMPASVIPMQKLIPYMRKFSKKLLSPDEANRILKEITAARLGSRNGGLFDAWNLLRLLLLVVLFVGCWYAFGDAVEQLRGQLQEQREKTSSPQLFHSDGRRKSEQEIWEDSLRCIYSDDTGRCVCYDPGGSKIDLEPEKCQSLSERGSILKR